MIAIANFWPLELPHKQAPFSHSYPLLFANKNEIIQIEESQIFATSEEQTNNWTWPADSQLARVKKQLIRSKVSSREFSFAGD